MSAAPPPAIEETPEKVTPGIPAALTLPAPAPVSVQLDEAAVTVSELAPVTLMPEISAAGRVVVAPSAVTEMSVPDAAIVTLPLEAIVHGAGV